MEEQHAVAKSLVQIRLKMRPRGNLRLSDRKSPACSDGGKMVAQAAPVSLLGRGNGCHLFGTWAQRLSTLTGFVRPFFPREGRGDVSGMFLGCFSRERTAPVMRSLLAGEMRTMRTMRTGRIWCVRCQDCRDEIDRGGMRDER